MRNIQSNPKWREPFISYDNSWVTDVALAKVNENTRMNSFQTNFCHPSVCNLDYAACLLGKILSLSFFLSLFLLRVLHNGSACSSRDIVCYKRAMSQSINFAIQKYIIKRLCLTLDGKHSKNLKFEIACYYCMQSALHWCKRNLKI